MRLGMMRLSAFFLIASVVANAEDNCLNLFQARQDTTPQVIEQNSSNVAPETVEDKEAACSLGDAEDCAALQAAIKRFREDEDDVGDEAGAMMKELGQVPPNLIQTLRGNFTQEKNNDTIFGGFKVHFGPFTVGGSKGVSVAPQMQFGMESNHFNFVAGCGDLRSGIKCEATAEVRQICKTQGRGIKDFCNNLKCHGQELLPPGLQAANLGAEVINLLSSEIGIDGSGPFHINGKITFAQGASVMGGAALGLWEDADGFRMIGGGIAGLKKEVGGEIYVGIHRSGHRAKFKIAAGFGTAEGEFDCRQKKKNSQKANRIQQSSPITTNSAKKFTPVGYGYGRGPNGQKTSGYCRMYVSWTDCLLQCERESYCIGFSAEQSYDPYWQQCCVHTSTYRPLVGWSSFSGSGDAITESTGSHCKNRLVMATHSFVRIGSGYGRGANGEKTHGYDKLLVSFDDCKAQCEADPSCTGFDAERVWRPYWQQCVIRTLNLNYKPYGWKGGWSKSVPVVMATSKDMHHNREVWVKSVR